MQIQYSHPAQVGGVPVAMATAPNPLMPRREHEKELVFVPHATTGATFSDPPPSTAAPPSRVAAGVEVPPPDPTAPPSRVAAAEPGVVESLGGLASEAVGPPAPGAPEEGEPLELPCP